MGTLDKKDNENFMKIKVLILGSGESGASQVSLLAVVMFLVHIQITLEHKVTQMYLVMLQCKDQ